MRSATCRRPAPTASDRKMRRRATPTRWCRKRADAPRQSPRARKPYPGQTVPEAKGATAPFLQVYNEYKKAPDVTRQRMYLETMERLFGGTDKIILDQGGGGVVPYLPLDQLSRRPQTPPQTGGSR